MITIYSLIDNIPTIHQIHHNEDTAKPVLIDFAINYILTKRKEENKDKLSLPLSEIKIDTFTEFPAYTYHQVDEHLIEIIQHTALEKIEKGWVWNGVSKVIDSKKIGIFQILPVIESTIVSNQSQMCQDVENIIQEIIDEINNANEELNKDIEEVKNLRYDIRETLDEVNNSNITIDIPYSRNLYPEQPTTSNVSSNEGFDKRHVFSYEKKYLPFLDYEQQGDQDQGEEKINNNVEDDIDLHPIPVFQRCRSNRRGSRTNYQQSRKMRLRAY